MDSPFQPHCGLDRIQAVTVHFVAVGQLVEPFDRHWEPPVAGFGSAQKPVFVPA